MAQGGAWVVTGRATAPLATGRYHQRPIRIPDIPFCPLRSGNVRRIRAAFLFGLLKRKLRRDYARLTDSSGWAPAADLQSVIPRRPQRRLVHSGLPAQDDLH
jgi:hypothetical protein